MIKLLPLLLIFNLISGCTTNIGEFTVLSTRNVEFQSTPVLVERNVKASTSRTTIFWLIKFGKPELRETIHKVLRKHEADFLTNVVLYTRDWSFFTLFGQKGFMVKADAWRNGSSTPDDMGLMDVVRPNKEYVLEKLPNHAGFRILELKTEQN